MILAALLLGGCALFQEEPLVIVHDPLVPEEISPLPRAVLVRPPAAEYEPVYSVMRIIEVAEVHGVQKFFLVRAGADKTHIVEGKEAEIADDAEFKKIIGVCTIIEIFGDFFRCEVKRLDYKIGPSAHIRIKTGESLKG
jgi:hypothetical protein